MVEGDCDEVGLVSEQSFLYECPFTQTKHIINLQNEMKICRVLNKASLWRNCLCVLSGCIGDWDHQQISSEAVWKLGFCQRQAALQILPEWSGRTAAQTVAALKKRGGDGGKRTCSGAAWQPQLWPGHFILLYTHRKHTHKRNMHTAMCRPADTVCPWLLNNWFRKKQTGKKVPPDVFIKGSLMLSVTKTGQKRAVVSRMTFKLKTPQRSVVRQLRRDMSDTWGDTVPHQILQQRQ